MPASIFSETELARLASFPEEIPGDDLIRAFTLTGADRDLVAIRRGAANRLGLALQLCALRYLGFVPRNLSAAPRSAACFVADQLSRPKASNSWSTLKWLGQGASGESPGSIKSEVAKLAFLRQLGAPEWDLSDLNPNRRKFLAQVGRRSTSQTLQRMPDRRRYPILVALLHETTLDLVDEIVDLFNRALKKTDSRSRRELEAWRVATAQATNEKVRLFSRLGRLVLDPDIPDEPLRRRIFEEVASRELFAAAVEETEQLLRPRDGSYLDFVENRYGPLRKFAPGVLRVLDFKSLKTDDPLIDAVEILRELNRKRRRRVPEDAGLEFASAKWRGQLFGIRRASQSPVLRALCSLPTP